MNEEERMGRIRAILKTLPIKPGVYLMHDETGKVIYVDKAKKLKRRVSSYFNHRDFAIPRLRKLVQTVCDISFIRTETEADDLLDELIDRYGDPPPGVNALIQVAILRGVAGNAGITDIVQKQGELRFTLKEFNMEKVSELYARPEYKGKLRVEAGSKPCLSLKIKSKKNVIDEAREFALAWGGDNEERSTS